MNWTQLIIELAKIAGTLIPGPVDDLLISAAVDLVAHIKGQAGISTDDILTQAGVQLDEVELNLLEDLVRLKELQNAPLPDPPA
jgi:hypothetical protein